MCVDPRRGSGCLAFVAIAGPAARRFPVAVLGGTWTDCNQTSPSFLPALVDTVNRLVEGGSFVHAALSDLAARSDAIEYFDMTPYLSRRNVPSSGSDGESLYCDPSHISTAASWKLGEEIQDAYGMPPPLAALAEAARGNRARAAVAGGSANERREQN